MSLDRTDTPSEPSRSPEEAPDFLWLQRHLNWEQHFLSKEQWGLLGLGSKPDGTPDHSRRVRTHADIHHNYPEGVDAWSLTHVPGGVRPVDEKYQNSY